MAKENALNLLVTLEQWLDQQPASGELGAPVVQWFKDKDKDKVKVAKIKAAGTYPYLRLSLFDVEQAQGEQGGKDVFMLIVTIQISQAPLYDVGRAVRTPHEAESWYWYSLLRSLPEQKCIDELDEIYQAEHVELRPTKDFHQPPEVTTGNYLRAIVELNVFYTKK